MPITRMFFNWNRPALPAVVEYLVNRFRSGTTLDLDNVILVLPGGRAGRLLTERLVAYCEEHSLVLLPPEHCTVGRLPEYLYESHRPFANDLTQQFAWIRALRASDQEQCKRFIQRLPRDEDHALWIELGALLQRQHCELAADALDFAAVAKRGGKLPGFAEQERWTFLAEVQRRYLQTLDDLQLWDLQTARLFAIEHQLCHTDREIVLVGTTDMNIAMRRMLDQVADHVTALIHAPEALQDRFDEHGCLIPDQWQQVPIGVTTEQIRVVEGPREQAEETVRCLASLGGHYRADQVVIGVLDESLVPQLLRQLDECQVAGRWVVGRTLSETAPYRLLEALAAYLEGEQFVDFATLVRHPDVQQWLTQRIESAQWLTELDDYHNEHLQPRLGVWLEESEEGDHIALKRAVELINEIVARTRRVLQPLAQWGAAIAQLLASFYADRTFLMDQPRDTYTLGALQAIRQTLLMLQDIPSEIAPTLSATQAIGQVLAQVASQQIPSPHEPGQVELLGWLELPLDTAPALIVTGFNEGNVPTSVNSDLFLPNQLRQQLALVDNRRRYARDAYALSVLQASRAELTLIAGRFTADHDPLTPSRLAFATDLKTMAQRALAFFESEGEDAGSHKAIISVGKAARRSNIVVPRPKPLGKPITQIGVTSFRTYIECPYRFYLRYILKLASMDDTAEELEASAFGVLLHDVLSAFGKGPASKSTDTEEIDAFLQGELDRLVDERLGKERLPAVDIQIVQARHRLRAFAQWQAEHAASGWEIAHAETSGGKDAPKLHLAADTSVRLSGRIDRIDRRGDEWLILDYKTGDKAKTPQETHLKKGEWVDLQLPLYVHLARSLGIKGPLRLGYILLPKETEKTGQVIAQWDDEMLELADAKAIEVASDIVAQKFWPPAQLDYTSEFASICQEDAFRPHLEGVGN